jgi:hypothetical protein
LLVRHVRSPPSEIRAPVPNGVTSIECGERLNACANRTGLVLVCTDSARRGERHCRCPECDADQEHRHVHADVFHVGPLPAALAAVVATTIGRHGAGVKRTDCAAFRCAVRSGAGDGRTPPSTLGVQTQRLSKSPNTNLSPSSREGRHGASAPLAEDDLVAAIVAEAESNWRAAAWLLERRWPERWAARRTQWGMREAVLSGLDSMPTPVGRGSRHSYVVRRSVDSVGPAFSVQECPLSSGARITNRLRTCPVTAPHRNTR